MNKPRAGQLRILNLEDDPNDSELILAELLCEWPHAEIVRVETCADFIAALAQGGFDLILSDYNLPDFDGPSALALAKAEVPEVPFIFVSGEIGEERAIECLKQGAEDYVLKHNLDKLPLVMHRALNETRERQARQKAEHTLQKNEQRFRTLTLATSQIVWTTNANGEVHEDLPLWQAFTGQSEDDAKGMGWCSAVHPDDLDRVRAAWSIAICNQSAYEIEHRIRRYDGEYRDFSVRGVPIIDQDGLVLEWIGTCTDITDQKHSQALIWRQANFDPLTELPNRQMFYDRLAQEIVQSNRTDLPLALLLIDLDEFKEVNDTLGHDKGDLLLQATTHRIAECIGENDTLARLGGDEFIVILPQLSDIHHAEDVAQQILNRMTEPFPLANELAHVSVSIGITQYPNDATETRSLMKCADQAMYLSKNLGRNRFSHYRPELQETAQKRLRLTNDLRKALAANQFQVYYQPIVELATGSIHKAEALIRWFHPEKGVVSPAEFIPIAEVTGLINDIGFWVFQQAARQVKHWQQQINPDFQISVNRSPAEFYHMHANKHAPCNQFLQELGLLGQSIVYEITEGILLNNNSRVRATFKHFSDANIQVALDDFGTGYSSLSYLKKFDINYLKIDKSFIDHLTENTHDLALCEAIIVMAHNLGLKVIAEGIETEQQLKIITEFGCDYAQGYLFSKPVPPEIFEEIDGVKNIKIKII